MFRSLQFFLSTLIIMYSVPSAYQQTTGLCPGGVQSLPIDCDPKHPWPRCPPQTYCYATNSVDVGPYFCCPATTSYSVSPNSLPSSIFGTTTQWPVPNPLPSAQMGTWPSGQALPPVRARKPVANEDTKRIRNSINQWLEKRQQGLHSSTTSQQ